MTPWLLSHAAADALVFRKAVGLQCMSEYKADIIDRHLILAVIATNPHGGSPALFVSDFQLTSGLLSLQV